MDRAQEKVAKSVHIQSNLASHLEIPIHDQTHSIHLARDQQGSGISEYGSSGGKYLELQTLGHYIDRSRTHEGIWKVVILRKLLMLTRVACVGPRQRVLSLVQDYSGT